jgi:hypothetical protein
MDDYNRNAVRIAGLLQVKFMGWVHRQPVADVWLDFGVEGEHGQLQSRYNGSLVEMGEDKTEE